MGNLTKNKQVLIILSVIVILYYLWYVYTSEYEFKTFSVILKGGSRDNITASLRGANSTNNAAFLGYFENQIQLAQRAQSLEIKRLAIQSWDKGGYFNGQIEVTVYFRSFVPKEKAEGIFQNLLKYFGEQWYSYITAEIYYPNGYPKK